MREEKKSLYIDKTKHNCSPFLLEKVSLNGSDMKNWRIHLGDQHTQCLRCKALLTVGNHSITSFLTLARTEKKSATFDQTSTEDLIPNSPSLGESLSSAKEPVCQFGVGRVNLWHSSLGNNLC